MLIRGIAAFLVSLVLAAFPAKADAVADLYKGLRRLKIWLLLKRSGF